MTKQDYINLCVEKAVERAKRGQSHSKGFVHNAKDASETFSGIAKAMAEQWG